MFTLTVPDMHCGGCVRSVTRALTRLDGEAKVEADPGTHEVKVATSADLSAVLDTLAAAGFPAKAG
ncbi:heavy-metal-associated domain-containing protein [Acuticoccus kandeliae]|uniref:heavy-metal-associated domain-containing protein n=1 Tax=Acuticoccus kandeliae TaxID=2073160 RepID=UPI000D3E364F|nr:heavy-metal-associated domain-containing protein [Acuticoccus kandeliae]